jgi:hypothetical protein
VRAAACYNQKTLKSAANANVNLFILEPDAHERLDLSDIIGVPASKPQPPPQKEKEIKKEDPLPRKEQKKQQAQAQPSDAPPQPRSGKDGGVGGKIKDLFGIEE